MKTKNLAAIRQYAASVICLHAPDIHAAMAECELRGDGNYRITLASDPPEKEERADRSYTGRMVQPVHSVEVRDGVASYV